MPSSKKVIIKCVETGRYMCPDCEDGFATMLDLKEHIGRAHTVQCFPCIPRGQRIRPRGRVHRYEETETGEYQCPYCPETRVHKNTLSEHVREYHPVAAGRAVMPFNCEYCARRFSTSTKRQHHIKNHHEITMHSCPHEGCNYEAKNQAALGAHYAGKHMDMSRIILAIRGGKCGCLNCGHIMNPPSAKYHVSTCHPTSPFCKNK